jgi:hypothetical protein
MIRRNRVKQAEYNIIGDICFITVYGMDGLPKGPILVDAINAESCKLVKWHANGERKGELSKVCGRIDGKETRLHHFLFGKPPEGMEYDHKNRNPLDNRRENLRLCSLTQNQYNRDIRKTNTSGYKGVCDKNAKRFRARIWHNSRQVHLGYFDTKEEAALAYDVAALKIQGEFACLNLGV